MRELRCFRRLLQQKPTVTPFILSHSSTTLSLLLGLTGCLTMYVVPRAGNTIALMIRYVCAVATGEKGKHKRKFPILFTLTVHLPAGEEKSKARRPHTHTHTKKTHCGAAYPVPAPQTVSTTVQSRVCTAVTITNALQDHHTATTCTRGYDSTTVRTVLRGMTIQ